jgi:hypothetical protein
MSARGCIRALVVLTVVGVPGLAGAQTPTTVTRPADQVRKRTLAPVDPAATLLQMQAIIGRMAVSSELEPADAQDLMERLAQARGRAIAQPALKALATHLALAVAQGSWDDESVERLAQDLFAGVNSRELTSREAALLVVDVSTLLRDAGVEALAIEAVANAFRGISPAGIDRLEAPSARGGLSVLTRR